MKEIKTATLNAATEKWNASHPEKPVDIVDIAMLCDKDVSIANAVKRITTAPDNDDSQEDEAERLMEQVADTKYRYVSIGEALAGQNDDDDIGRYLGKAEDDDDGKDAEAESDEDRWQFFAIKPDIQNVRFSRQEIYKSIKNSCSEASANDLTDAVWKIIRRKFAIHEDVESFVVSRAGKSDFDARSLRLLVDCYGRAASTGQETD